jgi:hypothetical protein
MPRTQLSTPANPFTTPITLVMEMSFETSHRAVGSRGLNIHTPALVVPPPLPLFTPFSLTLHLASPFHALSSEASILQAKLKPAARTMRPHAFQTLTNASLRVRGRLQECVHGFYFSNVGYDGFLRQSTKPTLETLIDLHSAPSYIKDIQQCHLCKIIDYRCEDGRFPVYATCVTDSNPFFAVQQLTRD